MRSKILRCSLLVLATAIGAAGCGGSSSNADAPANGVPAPEPAYDMAAIMQGMADSLDTQRTILGKAAMSWESITDADRQSLWSAIEDQMRLGDEYQAMLSAYPEWTESSCEWYISVVLTPKLQAGKARSKLITQSSSADYARTRYGELLIDAAGSKDAVDAFIKWVNNDPGAPKNILGLCYRFGYAQDIDGDIRFVPSEGP